MKFIVFITFLCALEAGFAFTVSKKGVEDAIIGLQYQVTRVLSELPLYQKDFSYELNQRLSTEAINTMQAINDITNPVLENIETDVQKAKAEGKDADPCFETARQELAATSKKGYDEIEQCKIDASFTVKPHLESIDNAIKTGEDLKLKLTNILINCMSGDYWQQKKCIITQLPSAAASVNLLKKTSRQLQDDCVSFLNEAEAQVRPCFSQAKSKVFEDTLKIRRTVSNCLTNL